jgi:hypothetical protein
MTYNFLVILPKVSEPQSYTISIRVASPVAIQHKMNNGMFGLPKIFKLMGGARTAVVSVKYVDYAVARTVLNTIDEWFMALPQSKSGIVWRFIRKRTDYIPLISRYIAGITVTALIVSNLSHLLPAAPNLFDLARFLVLSFVGIFTAYKIAHHVGSAAEDSLDNLVDLSYICITDGDRRELKLAEARNRGALRWGSVKLVLSLLVSVAAKLIVFGIVGTI